MQGSQPPGVGTLLVSADIIEINREPHVIATCIDITQRKLAEAELLRTLARERSGPVTKQFRLDGVARVPYATGNYSVVCRNPGGLSGSAQPGRAQRSSSVNPQTETLLWLAQGKTNSEIAVILGNTESTVKKHVLEIFEKLGVENRTAATLCALEVLSSPAAHGQSDETACRRVGVGA
jgi:DNA-binding CsgD family transcriptional regulator